MRFLIPTFFAVLVASCSPVIEQRPAPPPSEAPRVLAAPKEEPGSVPQVISRQSPPRSIRATLSGVVFEGVAFDSCGHRLVVVEQQGAPGSKFADAEKAARAVGGIAAVNGGFFTPEGEPLGLVVANGERFGAWNSASSLGSGVWHADGAGRSVISRRETLGRSGAAAMHELLQAGPLLVENGHAVGGLDAEKTSARTMILWDGGSRWWIGRSSPAPLAQVALTLAGSPVPGWPVRHALNLDGGRSSDLWISGKVNGGPVSIRPPWNKPVRNFLVLVPAR
jgi:hypothetical protein